MKLKFRACSVAILVALCVGVWASLVSSLGAATQSANQATALEVRLAEAEPAAGLVEAAVSGSAEKVYLHREIIVTSADVAGARVLPGNRGADFSISVAFTREGAAKMAQATASHVNKPLAILIKGQVVAAPTLRDQVSDSAVIDGHFTTAEADAIAAALNRK